MRFAITERQVLFVADSDLSSLSWLGSKLCGVMKHHTSPKYRSFCNLFTQISNILEQMLTSVNESKLTSHLLLTVAQFY